MIEHDSILWLVLLFIALLYIGAPLHIRISQRFAAHPELEALDLKQLDPAIAQFLMSHTVELFNLGFDEPTLVQIPSPGPNIRSYLIMLVNRQKGDKAMVTAMVAPPLGRSVLYFEFSTRFESGEVFDTHNIGELLFPPGPKKVRTQVPQVRDAKRLYQLHNYVMDKHGLGGKKVLYESGKALEFIADFVFIESFEDYARRGLMYYDPGADCYRPTLKGAFLRTWALLQPIKAFRNAALRRRARKIVEEFEQGIR
jgi:hypothetical protein